MQLNPIGIIAAISAFLGVWFGHAAVRKIEFILPTISLPTIIFAGLGIIFELFSLSINDRSISTALGILGITLLWDALEFTRQQRRVCKGHAPANPRNPRHIKIMAEHPSATKFDLLKKITHQR